MKSTGEVMGIDYNLGLAFAKSQLAAGQTLPAAGNVFLSVRDADKDGMAAVARRLTALGFSVLATAGTAARIRERGTCCEQVNKVSQALQDFLP